MKKLILAVLMVFLWVGTSSAMVMDFDELSSSMGWNYPLFTYQGFAFDNAVVLQTDRFPLAESGYTNGVVSPDNILYNDWGDEMSMSRNDLFTLNDFYLTAAWNNRLNVRVTGIGATGTEDYMEEFIVSTQGPTLIGLDWLNLSAVVFESWGGVDGGYGGGGTHFAIDNLRYDESTAAPVPEPATCMLLGAGLAGMAFVQRKKMRAKK